eukprot:GEZU01016931.1.p1 GENE.GEZU01016931.1~~GEZU01016931.1.p1  ORF type:complete len:266 (+),score=76.03 GEZU01016931.1:25-798(+)
MNYEEEQTNEIEALKAIYLDDFEEVDTKPMKFKINIYPHTGEGDDVNFVGATLQVTYTPKYPEELPIVNVFPLNGLTKAEADELKAFLDQVAQDNLNGMVMIFTLASEAQQWLLQRNDRREQEQNEMNLAAELAKKEEEKKKELAKLTRFSDVEGVEEKRLKGTPVTIEAFREWKIKFDEERLAKQKQAEQEAEKTINTQKKVRMTGRQLFESRAASSVLVFDEELFDDGTFEADVEVDESAFQDPDDGDSSEVSGQ